MKKLGIIGGLGPMATAYFFQLIVEMTEAKTDQQHIEMLIHNCPMIPDRTQYILGKSAENPLDKMIAIGSRLAEAGVDVLAIPCITAHYFHQELEREIGLPVIHAIRETAKYLRQRGYRKAGIMATDGTVQMGLFTQDMEEYGIDCIYPSETGQKKVMHLIYDNVKAGTAIERPLFEEVSAELFAKGAEVIILGCTELSLLKCNRMVGSGCLDVTEVLAKCCVEQCAVLKEEYRELITT